MEVPPGFAALALPGNAFMTGNGPVFAKREAAADGDKLVLGIRVEERHCSSTGLCHGGMLMSMADLSLTIGVNVQAGLSRFLPTVGVTCDFIGPAPAGEWLEARVEVLRATRNLVFAQGMLSLEHGTPVARFSGILKISGDPDPRYGPERYMPPREDEK